MTTDLDAFLADVNRSQLGWETSLRFTYDKTRELLAAGVKGDLVECGVAAGCHPAAFWRACHDEGVTRSIRLFDNFQGIPHGGEKDGDAWNAHWGDGSGRLEPSGVAVCSLPDAQANLTRWGCDMDCFSFFVGWFQTSLPKVGPAWAAAVERGEADGIAYLRLDGDLYESTRVCLEHLYPLVVSGGIVVADDLNLSGCREAVREYMTGIGAGDQVWNEITASGDAWTVKP